MASPNVHVHISTPDLARSAAFYEALFGPPVKVKPGYRKFLPTFAPLNLAISERPAGGAPPPTVNHMGVQFGTSAEVAAHLGRVKAAGIAVLEEKNVSCCHANQDKFWVRDPDGSAWEFYAVNFDIEESSPPPAQQGCCTRAPSPATSTDGGTRGA